MDFKIILSNDPKDFAAQVKAWLQKNAHAQQTLNYSFDLLETRGGVVWFVMTIFFVPPQSQQGVS